MNFKNRKELEQNDYVYFQENDELKLATIKEIILEKNRVKLYLIKEKKEIECKLQLSDTIHLIETNKSHLKKIFEKL